jgi:monoamine oxidase
MKGPRLDFDVIVIGAGAAGLAAAGELARAGKSVRCLEASARIGGRAFTVYDPLTPVPVELGAEFIHGRPPEILGLAERAGLPIYEASHHAVFMDNGEPSADEEADDAAGTILERADATAKNDQTFEEFLARSHQPEDVKQRAIAYVEGFNAARKERVSVAALKQDAEAAAEIDGGRAFRLLGGYQSLMLALLRDSDSVQLNTIVERVEWRKERVRVHAVSALDGARSEFTCRRLIVTVSLGVLQAPAGAQGAIEFRPAVERIAAAAGRLEFGQVYRVTFRFERAFWEEETGFLVSREELFPTWWTRYPVLTPMLTGWSAGPAGERLQGAGQGVVIAEALASLGRILGQEIPRPAAAWFHDWHADPFHRGAYSYVPAGALEARRELAEPVEETLFFAGEAASINGHGGTIHGAIASGLRAARLVK